ncbi:MAG: hypothetical protein ACRCR6_04620 [Plesiomonas sp.]
MDVVSAGKSQLPWSQTVPDTIRREEVAQSESLDKLINKVVGKGENSYDGDAIKQSQRVGMPQAAPKQDLLETVVQQRALIDEFNKFPNIDQLKVVEITKSLRSGLLDIDSDKLASAMLDFYKG